MRTVLILIQRAKRSIHKLQLEPGTKVSDLLQALNVQAHVLARASAPTNPFPSEAEVHSLVCDSDHLIARSSLEAAGDAPPLTLSFSNEEA
jgi:hypothetical protein